MILIFSPTEATLVFSFLGDTSKTTIARWWVLVLDIYLKNKKKGKKNSSCFLMKESPSQIKKQCHKILVLYLCSCMISCLGKGNLIEQLLYALPSIETGWLLPSVSMEVIIPISVRIHLFCLIFLISPSCNK